MAFWKWWTIFVLTVVATAYAQVTFNISQYLLDLDITRLSIATIIIFLVANAYVSYYSFLIQFYKQKISETKINMLWFCGNDILPGLGMIGTMIGFLIVLMTAFENIDVSDAAGMKEIIGYVATGMGVALITTLTGLITSLLLKLQLNLMEAENEKL